MSKSELISIRFEPADYRKVLKLAKNLRMKVPEYIRQVAIKEGKDDLLRRLKEKDEKLNEKNEAIKNQEIEYKKLFKTAKKATYLVVEFSKKINLDMLKDTVQTRRKLVEDLKKIANEKIEIKK